MEQIKLADSPDYGVDSAELHGVVFESQVSKLDDNQLQTFLDRWAKPTTEGGHKETHFLACLRMASNLAMVDCLYHPNVFDPEGKQSPHTKVRRDSVPLNKGATIVRQYNWLNAQGKMRVPFEDVLPTAWETWAESTRKLLPYFSRQDITLNSPAWTGLGTALGQTAACFVEPISDDLVRNPDAIMATLRNSVAIQQTGGGNGFNFADLRPKGWVVKRSGGRSTGAVGFLKMYDSVFGLIEQGGTRRGANMAVMDVWHPDIEEFIHCKEEEGEISNFNISVAVTDEFMEAVKNGTSFNLRWGDQVVKTVDARKLWREICELAHRNGEPGVLFIDQANRENPVPHLYVLRATNPCGEQWLGPHENCCLGHLNLAHCVTPDSRVDWAKLEELSVILTQALDNNVDANNYVEVVPELEIAAMNVRRIGVSFMGLADLMVQTGVRYGSREGQELAGQISEFIRFHTMRTSVERAKGRGPFEKIKGSIYDPSNLVWEVPRVRYELDFGRPKLDWSLVTAGLRSWGIRNGAQMTVAPTGTTGTVAGVDGYGCEPIFGLSYTRVRKTRDGDKVMTYLNARFERALRAQGLTDDECQKILEKVKADPNGSCQGIDEVPDAIKHVFVMAGDIQPEGHIRMQAAMQRWIDNSISKTVNFPYEATVEDVEKAYFLLHDLGCKGGTVYRQGSRQDEVLTNTGRVRQPKLSIRINGRKVKAYIAAPKAAELFREPRRNERGELLPISLPPQVEEIGIPALRLKTATATGEGGGDASMSVVATLSDAILVFPDENTRLLEVFLNVGKSGQDTQVTAEAIGRQTSTQLRLGASLEAVTDQLNDIGGRNVVGFGERKVRSMPDALAKVLKRVARVIGRERNGNGENGHDPIAEKFEQIKVNTVSAQYELCGKCGNRSVVFLEGCFQCLTSLGGCGKNQGCA